MLRNKIDHYRNYDSVILDKSAGILGKTTNKVKTLIGYYKTDTLIRIVEFICKSNEVFKNTYYFDKENLICVYSREKKVHNHHCKNNFDFYKTSDEVLGRYYFQNNELVDANIRNKRRIPTKEKDGAEFLQLSKIYLTLLKKEKR